MADEDIDALKAKFGIYYPGVPNPEASLPTCWNCRDKNNSIGLSQKNLRASYKGADAKRNKEAASVRANKPIPPSAGAYYFEIRIVSKGKEGHIGIGFATENAQLSKLPGWERDSYGYHADDGNFFGGSGTGQSYGPTYTTGDVVGCCLNFGERILFFTKNGIPLGPASRTLPTVPSLFYPIIGMRTAGEIIEANFGQEPFRFDFENYLKELRAHARAEALSTPIAVPNSPGPLSSHIRTLVLSYLCSSGYAATAQAFSRTSGAPLPEPIGVVKSRQHLQKLILDGLIGEAIDYINQTFPDLLLLKQQLHFTLRCQQFIEAIRLTFVDGSKPNFLTTPSRSSSMSKPTSDGNQSAANTSADKAGPSASTSFIEQPATSSSVSTEPSNNTSSDPAAKVAPAPMDDGPSGAATPSALEVTVDCDASATTNGTKNGHHRSMTLDALITLGRDVFTLGEELAKRHELQLAQQQQMALNAGRPVSALASGPRDLAVGGGVGTVSTVSGPAVGVGPVLALGGGVSRPVSDTSPPVSPFRTKMRDVLSLIADANPSQSPLLSVEHREVVWCDVSRAVLEAQLPPGSGGLAPLEQLTSHSRQLAFTLGRYQLPAVSLLPFDSFYYSRQQPTKSSPAPTAENGRNGGSLPQQPSTSGACCISEPC